MNPRYALYGDGVHDDYPAIQEMIDSGVCEVCLPVPERFYLISSALELPSNFRLVLPRYAEIRLADGANCVMVRNKMVRDHARRLPDFAYENPVLRHIWGYVDDYSPDAPCCNIEICGGIWNMNNLNQLCNPERAASFPVREFYGVAMLFYNVRNFKLKSLTLKDPSQYAVALDTVSYFTIDDITFDFNKGNPYPINMDGIHLDGNCHYGRISNLKGTCYDDLIALNAHEGSAGPITNIEINGIYAEECHSAVRLLLVNERISNIHISNVFGTFYQYCIGVTKFYSGETTGRYDALSFDHIYDAKAMPVRKGEFQHPPIGTDSYPMIYIQENTVTGTLTIESMHRQEKTLPRDTVYVGDDAQIDRLILDNITTVNQTALDMPLLRNKGSIRYLSMRRIDSAGDEVLVNTGEIGILDRT